ncbi:Short-chain dehydrogenase/reductase SDR [Penicillium camemberti]|uniref:Short-chain dehydrogenase/reductase SDR n=1 Tax=Penicillium camemberti (strain FM 013) TaxID=1429867 RepID=A0A0G4P2D0_PENC3|nr:Short-chain dehydrogenase/reductase SDR [Penicillium camemberti]
MPPLNKHISKLAGANVLIIGGTAGVGYAVAEAVVEYGAASVILSSSNLDRVSTSTLRLRESYPSTACQITGFACDLKQESLLESNIEGLFNAATLEGTRQLNHVIFTAGDHPNPKPLSEIDFNFIKETGLVRFFAPLLIAKHAMKHMAPGPASSISFTSGISAYRPYPNWNALGAYTGSLEGMVRSLAVEMKPVRVNLVCLGPVDTDLIARWYSTPEERKRGIDAIGSTSVTGAIGQAEDVAEAYVYCMKDYNLTASVINSNGGMLMV